jgi:hypothetical protein
MGPHGRRVESGRGADAKTWILTLAGPLVIVPVQ